MTRTQAMAYLRKNIKDEGYFQKNIIKALNIKYPLAFVTKIAQGAYSQSGIPDVLCIVDGHYFGFEVKRPILGKPSKVQLQTIRWISDAGGTAAVVSYPEECFAIIEEWRNHEREKSKIQ